MAEKPTTEVTIPDLIRDMVGREISTLYPKQPARLGDAVLEVRGLTHKGYFEDVSFTLRQGEILGFAGLIGAGRTELAQSLFGIDSIDAGQIIPPAYSFHPPPPPHPVRRARAHCP